MNQVFVELENIKIKQDQYSRELNKRWTIHTIRTSFFSSAIPFLCWDVESEIRFQLEDQRPVGK